jgi:lipoate-protein ligase B
MQLKVLTFPHRISYPKALNLQLEIVSKKLTDPKTPDYLILLEHEPSITIGRRMHSSSETINSHIPIFKVSIIKYTYLLSFYLLLRGLGSSWW